jgi:hypothetical protein
MTAEIASQDAVYVLAYSVIMLNTDLHNPQNRVCNACVAKRLLMTETDDD